MKKMKKKLSPRTQDISYMQESDKRSAVVVYCRLQRATVALCITVQQYSTDLDQALYHPADGYLR